MTWPTVALGEVATVERHGIQPADIARDAWYVGLEHIEPGGRNVTRQQAAEAELKSAKFQFGPEHILYGKLRPYLIKIATPDFSGVCSTDILPVRPGALINKRYLTHYLRQGEVVGLANSRATGANLPRLSPAELSSLPVPLPPLDEQRRIAAILDQADVIRASQENLVRHLTGMTHSLFETKFGDLFNPGHPTVVLGELATVFRDGPFGSNLKSSHYRNSGVRVVRLQNIGVGEFVDHDKVYVSEDHYNALTRHSCSPGDVLIGTMGDPNLRACILPASVDRALNKADCVQMRVDDSRAAALWVVALLNSPRMLSSLEGRLHGQTRVRISMSQLRSAPVPAVSRVEQQRFASQARDIASRVSEAKAGFAHYTELFESLRARAFKGEL